MRIGFVGAHRTGKSTLAKLVADRLNLKLLPNPNTAVQHGYDMKNGNRIADKAGFDLQGAILEGMLERIVGDNFVAERTPIDAAAYLLADATANAGDPIVHETALRYMDKAVRETFRRFDLLILVPPAIAVAPHPDKPPMNAAYQMHIHLMCRALCRDLDYVQPVAELPVEVTSLEERVQFVLAHVDEAKCARAVRKAVKG